MSKLSKEELLDEFKQMEVDEEEIRKGVLEVLGVNIEKMNQIHEKRKQALRQIKEMIRKPGVTEEWYEEKTKEMIEIISNYCFSVGELGNARPDAMNFIRKLVEEMPAKKPEVTEEWKEET